MIAVAIAGILAAIAYPSFMSQVRKSRRADAVAARAAIEQAQERWRANNAAYTTALTAGWPGGLGLSGTSPNEYYTLALSNASEAGYTLILTAVPGKSQASDTGCTSLTVRVDKGNSSPPLEQQKCWGR